MTDLINKLQIKIISDIKTKLEKNYETFKNEKITEIKNTLVVYTVRLDTEEDTEQCKKNSVNLIS